MRRKLLLLSMVPFVLLCSSLVVSAEVSSVWWRTYGGEWDEWAYSLVATSDGGYALAGNSVPLGGTGYTDFWLVKTDENGVVPEYSSWVAPSLVLAAAVPILVYRKRLLRAC